LKNLVRLPEGAVIGRRFGGGPGVGS
jgi:hypothetical protein